MSKKKTRSEIVTVRMDPKLKYGVELAARKQRRTMSSFIQWAVESALEEVTSPAPAGQEESIKKVLSAVWDPEPSDRLLNLAEKYPLLMTVEEEIIMKAIASDQFFWHQGKIRPESVNAYWEALHKLAAGDISTRPVVQKWSITKNALRSGGVVETKNP